MIIRDESCPRCRVLLPLRLRFFAPQRRSHALTANRLAPSQENCQVCSQRVRARLFVHVNLTHPLLVLHPPETSTDNQMKYACSAIFTFSQQWPSANAPEEKFHIPVCFVY